MSGTAGGRKSAPKARGMRSCEKISLQAKGLLPKAGKRLPFAIRLDIFPCQVCHHAADDKKAIVCPTSRDRATRDGLRSKNKR